LWKWKCKFCSPLHVNPLCLPPPPVVFSPRFYFPILLISSVFYASDGSPIFHRLPEHFSAPSKKQSPYCSPYVPEIPLQYVFLSACSFYFFFSGRADCGVPFLVSEPQSIHAPCPPPETLLTAPYLLSPPFGGIRIFFPLPLLFPVYLHSSLFPPSAYVSVNAFISHFFSSVGPLPPLHTWSQISLPPPPVPLILSFSIFNLFPYTSAYSDFFFSFRLFSYVYPSFGPLQSYKGRSKIFVFESPSTDYVAVCPPVPSCFSPFFTSILSLLRLGSFSDQSLPWPFPV